MSMIFEGGKRKEERKTLRGEKAFLKNVFSQNGKQKGSSK